MFINIISISRKKLLVFCRCLTLLFLVTGLYAEEVCKFEYLHLPELLNGDTIFVPVGTVAMSEYVHVGDPSDIILVGNACSIMFLVDVSVSNGETDHNGIRFEVIRAVLDTINKKNPNIRVGTAYFRGNLWHTPSDDPLFLPVPNHPQGVVPLLKLNETYKGVFTQATTMGDIVSQTDYEELGVDVVHLYFASRLYSVWGVIPQYLPTGNEGAGTGITNGFMGAKYALQQSPHPKNRQFIIFLSDGGTKISTGFVQAVETPTTFTIFYNPQSPGDLPQLKEFTKNVQNNGFSSSNPMSDIWDMALDVQKMIDVIVNDILSQIITSLTSFTPNDTLLVNGLTGIKVNKNGFMFEDLFPLKGKYTDFHYGIDYHIKKDSIAANGDTVTLAEYDSTVYLDYTVCVDDGDSLSDTIRLYWWDRELAFYYNGDEIEEDEFITEQMDEVELRFSYKKVDTLYEYGDVMDTLQFELRSLNAGDVEEYDLTDQGDYWSCNFPREVGITSSGDGTLQHGNGDSIIAIFRNGKLTLDTLRIGRLYDGVVTFALSRAIYFDNNADGKVDSVYLGISGSVDAAYVDEVMDEITLPAHRDFIVGNYSVVTGGIGIPVTENAPATLTYCTSDDYIEIADSIVLDDDVILMPGKVDIIDSMAPVIMSAMLIDSVMVGARDELTVVFSETIVPVTEAEPFNFYKTSQGILYEATLSVLSQSNTTGVFEMVSITGASAIVHGDSIRIDWALTDKIDDGLDNKQDNPENIRREIKVFLVEEGLKMTEGIYFDNNADGKVDSIYIGVYGEIEDYIDELMEVIILPAFRDFNVDSFRYTDGGIGLDVTEQNATIMTYVTDEDIIVIKDEVVLPDSMIILAAEVNVIDRVAPVIMKATIIDSVIVIQTGPVDSLTDLGRDELRIVFSETVGDITGDMPFKFYCTSQNITYDAELVLVGQNADNGVFTVKSLTNVVSIQNGDSIRINWTVGQNIYDDPGNNQDNPENIRREIEVEIIPDTIHIQANFNLVLKSTLINPRKKYKLSAEITAIPEVQEVVGKLTSVDGNYTGIMIITLEPDQKENVSDVDRYEGWLHVYDAMGNTIIRDEKMGYDGKNKQLIYVWDGRNLNGRVVGPGSYAAVVPVDFYFNEKKRPGKIGSEVKRGILGVKE